MKIFNETKKNMTLTQKFDYIKTHFTYWTLNSWNGLESIANKVKVYNLKLTAGQIDKFFEIISDENLCMEMNNTLNACICEFERNHAGYRVGFNGRSDGYLVLYSKDNNKSIINYDIDNADTYKELVDDFQRRYGWTYRDAQAEAKQEIEDLFDIIVAFDDLCDNMRNELVYILDNAEIIEEKYTKVETYKTLQFKE